MDFVKELNINKYVKDAKEKEKKESRYQVIRYKILKKDLRKLCETTANKGKQEALLWSIWGSLDRHILKKNKNRLQKELPHGLKLKFVSNNLYVYW
jgi:hypothetical protein